VLPLVGAEDVARVAAGIPAGHGAVDQVVLLTGEVLSIGEAAGAFGLRYTDIDPDEWRARAEVLYRDAVTVEHLSHLWALFKAIGGGHDLYQATESIERFGARPPLTLRD
jgi:hypothetical protein